MSAWTEHALTTLEREGFRAGSARRSVVELLGRQHCCLSAKEITAALHEQGREVGMASVYRALEALDDLKLVQRLDAGDGVVRYEPAHAGGDHHHHIVCEGCGDVAMYEDEDLERAITQLSRRLDFQIDAHDVMLRGECPTCSGPSRR